MRQICAESHGVTLQAIDKLDQTKPRVLERWHLNGRCRIDGLGDLGGKDSTIGTPRKQSRKQGIKLKYTDSNNQTISELFTSIAR